MEISSKQIMKVLLVLSWIIFIGVCVDAGGFICNTIFMLTQNPFGGTYFWNGANLTSLYDFDEGYFMVIASLMIIVAVMKSLMFYWIVKILHEQKLNMEQPFNKDVGDFIFKLSFAALAIGIFSSWTANYSIWLVEKGVAMPTLEQMNVGGADVWFFMTVILFVIGHIFKRGIEIQSENELTV